MRKAFSAVLGLTLALVFSALAQQPQQSPSLAEAARKAREAKKNAPKAKLAFDNDNIPREPSSASAAGEGGATGSGETTGEAAAKPAVTAGEEKKGLDEAAWRKRFDEAHSKLAAAEKELDILQRELNLNQQQYYTNPSKAMREQYTRGEINDQRGKIEAKKAEIEQLRQKLANLEDDLRRAGGPPAWARP